MDVVERLIVLVDGLNDRVGKVLCFSLIVIMLIQVMDVVLRYVFNNPTIWAMDTNTMLFTGASMLAGGYALLHDSHVKLDILYRNWGKRTRAMVDLFTMSLAIVAFCFVIWKGIDSFWWAWKTGQHANSYWAPPMWPVKLCLPVGGVLLLLQGVSRWLKLLLTVLGRDEEVRS
jgi:TRAP-type mannitol/chloroaromatic compound transport system permease small subunit